MGTTASSSSGAASNNSLNDVTPRSLRGNVRGDGLALEEVDVEYLSSNDEDDNGAQRPRAASFPASFTRAGPNGETSAQIVLNSKDTSGSVKESCWCLVKAKTRQHNSTKVSRRLIWYEAKPNGNTFSVGRSQSCDLRLDDDRCSSLNAVLEPHFVDNVPGIVLQPKARMYHLVGMGAKKNIQDAIIDIGSVIKVGSVSLEVTDLCTSDSDDFMQRFKKEIDSSPNNRKKTNDINSDGLTIEKSSTSEEAFVDEKSDTVSEENGLDEDDDASENTNNNNDNVSSTQAEEKTVEDNDEEDVDEMCYICWGDTENPETNPLIRNPCGKCSGSSQYVHLNCLLQWIKSSGSGHCSICNGALPQHFSSPPPNLELKVVRHRRGQSWIGTRRFRLSFSDRDSAIIGRDSEADVRLSDRSVGSVHAKITFNRETRQFQLSDCSSLGGTFLQVREQMYLEPDVATYLKIGRTLLSLRMTERKGTLLHMLQNPLTSWAKR